MTGVESSSCRTEQLGTLMKIVQPLVQDHICAGAQLALNRTSQLFVCGQVRTCSLMFHDFHQNCEETCSPSHQSVRLMTAERSKCHQCRCRWLDLEQLRRWSPAFRAGADDQRWPPPRNGARTKHYQGIYSVIAQDYSGVQMLYLFSRKWSLAAAEKKASWKRKNLMERWMVGLDL